MQEANVSGSKLAAADRLHGEEEAQTWVQECGSETYHHAHAWRRVGGRSRDRADKVAYRALRVHHATLKACSVLDGLVDPGWLASGPDRGQRQD